MELGITIRKMIKKSVIYKVQLDCPHHMKKPYKKFESNLDATNDTITQNPNYKACVTYNFYCTIKCKFLGCTFGLLLKQSQMHMY